MVGEEAGVDNGDLPIVPLLSHFWHFIFPHKYEYWMGMNFKWVRRCDVVLRLPGKSNGADKEVALAKSLGKTVYFGIHQLYPSEYFISEEQLNQF